MCRRHCSGGHRTTGGTETWVGPAPRISVREPAGSASTRQPRHEPIARLRVRGSPPATSSASPKPPPTKRVMPLAASCRGHNSWPSPDSSARRAREGRSPSAGRTHRPLTQRVHAACSLLVSPATPTPQPSAAAHPARFPDGEPSIGRLNTVGISPAALAGVCARPSDVACSDPEDHTSGPVAERGRSVVTRLRPRRGHRL